MPVEERHSNICGIFSRKERQTCLSHFCDVDVRGTIYYAGVVEVEDGAEHGRRDSIGDLVLSPKNMQRLYDDIVRIQTFGE